MKWSYINIIENDKHEFVVEAKLVEGTIWLSKWQIATLFNVYTKAIESNLKAIFKTGLLKEDEVTQIHTFVNEGYESTQILYNLDALIFIGFRIASFEAKAFRQWVLRAFSEYINNDKKYESDVLVTYKSDSKVPLIISLN